MTKWLDKLLARFQAPLLTRWRIVLALGIAVVADFLQVILVPLEFVFIQQIIDVVAMILTSLVIGFHWLLLPTFAVEFIPGVDMLPTWTGCVGAVIALRKRAQRPPPPEVLPATPPPIPKPVIELPPAEK